ncbi:hypothetical protein ACHAXS_014375 [Conticribra weissflogii]
MGQCKSKPAAPPPRETLPAKEEESPSSKHESLYSSTRSELRLTSHMIRERNADVWDYYEEIRRLGEGSIGCVSLVKRKKGTEGGSAYTHHESALARLFGCACMAGRRRKATSSSRSANPITNIRKEKKKSGQPSLHSEEYALKSIQLRLVEKKYLDELRNEIIVLRSLDHPNIVKAYEVYETRRNIYVLMEYCSGGDLYTRAPYTESQAVVLVRQLTSAIAHMHKNGIVHRDIKFENIMFESKDDPRAKIKVLDFGLSKKFMPGMSQIMTEGVGTVYTMAPQVFQGLYTSKADCWSIGVIAFILLCQEKPFKGKNRAQVVRNITKCRFNFNAPGWANVSSEAKKFVSALIVLNPSQRLTAENALKHPWLKKEEFPVDYEETDSSHKSLMTNVKDNILSYARMSELKRIAAVVVAHKSSAAEILDMREAFDKYDTEKDGVISFDEFKLALAKFNYTDEELNDIFSRMDVNCNGVILYTEFIAATLELHGRVEEKRLAEAFDLMDDDDSGFISKENLIKLLGNDVPPERIEKLIQQADFDGDGMISFEDFLTMFRKDNNLVVKEEVNGGLDESVISGTE